MLETESTLRGSYRERSNRRKMRRMAERAGAMRRTNLRESMDQRGARSAGAKIKKEERNPKRKTPQQDKFQAGNFWDVRGGRRRARIEALTLVEPSC